MLKNCLAALLLALCVSAPAFGAARRALLVGINDYSASGLGRAASPPPPSRDWTDLHGAVNDAGALREMLVAVYGFDEKDIVTLTDQAATREAILDAISEHLVKRASKGDILFFYFAGHGSQVRNSLSDESDRLDESLVPADSRLGVRDIRDKELRPLFSAIAERGARLTIVLDNCHSGSGTRGLPTGARARGIRADPRDLRDATRFPPPAEERGALVLSATQDFGQAWETRDATGRFHGAFSWALLRALRDSTSDESASETFQRAAARMRAETPFQEPVLAGNPESRLTPFLGARTDRRAERAVIAVERVLSDGTVLLQGGWANGLSAGTELRVISDRNIAARLRVTEMSGLTRSKARIEPGRTLPQSVKSGALVEVVGWTAPEGRPLRVWTPRIPANAEAIADLGRRLHAEAERRGVRWITDPLETTPTHVLRRGKEQWELLSAGGIESLGADASDAIAAVLRLPAGASLFAQFPAPAGMVDGIAIGPGTDREDIDPSDHPEHADYILAGRYVPSARQRLQFAWVRPGVIASDRRKSGLPLRSEWTAEDGRDHTLRDSVAVLRDAIVRLRRVHAWQLLESPPGERSPYRIALRRVRTGQYAQDSVTGDERYDVILRSFGPQLAHARPRYVYVFIIDSHGRSTLLFPRGGSVENRIPISFPPPREIRLDVAMEIAPPYGMDTYFLLTTDEALADPWILEWEGARKRAPREAPALDQLLSLVGTSARTGGLIVPASWSIERTVVESVPPRAKRQ